MTVKKDDSEGTPLLQQDQSYSSFPPSSDVFAGIVPQYEQQAQAGFYPTSPSDAAAAAAAALAAYQQQQQTMIYGSTGVIYPPLAPLSSSGSPLAFYPQPQFNIPPSSQAASSNASATRPPRASRRASPPQSHQVSQQQITSIPPHLNNTTGTPHWDAMSVLVADDKETRGSSSIPPLQDIFNNEQGLSNYGAIPNISTQGIQRHDRPKIWNAPATNKSKVQPFLVTTSPASGGAINKKSAKRNTKHRRSNSDLPLRPVHHRTGSGGSILDLPPMGHRRMGSESGIGRPRTFSAGSQSRPRHRRNASSSSLGTFSSNMSGVSVVSNIAKSSMFGGIDEKTGKALMHFPFEAIRLVFVDKKEEAYSQLREGHLYLCGNSTDFEIFEEYTRITNAMEEGAQPQWESLENPTSMWGKQQLLPDTNYLLAVDANIYKKVVGEISDAHGMPCGLFFCGHHEDVAHPSISIAMVVVAILFLSMAYIAFFIEGS